MRCVICGEAASMHVADAMSGSIKHYCLTHAPYQSDAAGHATSATLADKLDSLIDFLTSHGRMPDPSEFRQLGAAVGFHGIDDSRSLPQKLEYLKSVRDYLQSHGHLPPEGDPPDPF